MLKCINNKEKHLIFSGSSFDIEWPISLLMKQNRNQIYPVEYVKINIKNSKKCHVNSKYLQLINRPVTSFSVCLCSFLYKTVGLNFDEPD